MAITESEKQQIETAVDAFVESPNVQSGITKFVSEAEAQGVKVVDQIIANAHAGGLAGPILNALKGSAEAELNSFVASLPPAAIAALATKAFESELKSLLG
jgi:hypothetical protein